MSNRRNDNEAPRASMSFAELAGQTQRDMLKPYIREQVNQLGAQLRESLGLSILQTNAQMRTKLAVLENIITDKLGVTFEEMAERIADVEDAAWGYAKSTEPAAQGDMVRTTFMTRTDAETQFGSPAKIRINKLNAEPCQTYPEVESAVIGMSTGETKEVSVVVPAGKDQSTSYVFQVLVERVSKKVAGQVA